MCVCVSAAGKEAQTCFSTLRYVTVALRFSRSLSRSFSRITDVSVVSVLAERWKQKRPSSCGQSLLPPNPADPANHGPSILLHGGSTHTVQM